MFATPAEAPTIIAPPAVTLRNLYAGCAVSTVRYTEIKARSRATIKLFLGEVDERCMAWTLIWYPAITGQPIQNVNEEARARFNAMRYRILDDFQDELVTMYGIQR